MTTIFFFKNGFVTVIAAVFLFPVLFQDSKKREPKDIVLTLPTPETFKSKESLIEFTKTNSYYKLGRLPLVQEHNINGVKVVVMEYRKGGGIEFNGYFIYKDLNGVFIRIFETNFILERLFFESDNRSLTIKKGLNCPEVDLLTLKNFDTKLKLIIPQSVKD